MCAESCATLCGLMNCSPSGCSVHGIFQARIPAVAVKSLQACSTLCDPIDGSPPGSAVPGILQARVLEWVAIAFSTNLFYKAINTLIPKPDKDATHTKKKITSQYD